MNAWFPAGVPGAIVAVPDRLPFATCSVLAEIFAGSHAVPSAAHRLTDGVPAGQFVPVRATAVPACTGAVGPVSVGTGAGGASTVSDADTGTAFPGTGTQAIGTFSVPTRTDMTKSPGVRSTVPAWFSLTVPVMLASWIGCSCGVGGFWRGPCMGTEPTWAPVSRTAPDGCALFSGRGMGDAFGMIGGTSQFHVTATSSPTWYTGLDGAT